MTDRQLIKAARDFRRGILDGGTSHMMCFAVSIAFRDYLSFFEKIETEVEEGSVGNCNHFFLRLLDGRILDLTADQFEPDGEPRLPAVYLGPRPQWFGPVIPD